MSKMKLESFKTNIFELGHKNLKKKTCGSLKLKLNIFVASLKNIKFSHSSRGLENIENEPRSFRFANIEHLEARAKEISKLDIESVQIKS